MEHFSGYKLAQILETIAEFPADQSPVGSLMKATRTKLEFAGSNAEFVSQILALLEGSSNDLLSSAVSRALVVEHVAKIVAIRENFINACLQQYANQFLTTLKPVEAAVILKLYSDLVHTGGVKQDLALDRAEISIAANELLEFVRKSDLPEYAKSAIQLQISSLKTAIDHASIYPDIMIRSRIKCIVADFVADFDAFDRQFNTFYEELISFAKKFTGVGAFSLGMIADGSAVVPLLTGPK